MEKPTVAQLAARYGVTEDRICAQFALNAASLRTMLAKAERTGRKVNGYTADRLRELVADTEARADGRA
jgi:hypothetical protein